MKHEKEQTGSPMPIERFKHFKGIQLVSTSQYFCCDFYEIVHPDSSITYRIKADSKHTSLSTEMYQEDDIWKSKNRDIPEELEELLGNEIKNAFYKSDITATQPPAELDNNRTFLSRLKTYLLRKLYP